MASKRVAIIGAGISGLSAIKACLEEELVPVCLEKSDHVGGLWHYEKEVRDGVASVMKNTITNVCKETTPFSDYPFPEDAPNYLRNAEFLEYLESYAKEFDLLRYIQYNKEVVRVEEAEGYEENGQWLVTYRSNRK